MRKLPPLNALRAFEATGRHLSFSKAAEELFVTPAAVSQQVRGLEEWLSVPLFRRLTREIRLTEAGQKALPLMTEGLDRLAEGVSRLTDDDETGILTVSAAPTFAAKWLVPRLDSFNTRYPDLSVRLDASLGLVDFERDGVHVGIRLGPGKYPGLRADKLFDENVVPACSPSLMEGDHPLAAPADLAHHRLLHVDWGDLRDAPSWQRWLGHFKVDGVDASRGAVFTIENLAIQAAIGGQGVMLVNPIIIEAELAAGTLVMPFDMVLKSNTSVWVVAPERTADRPKIKAFRDWIYSEVAKILPE